MARGRKTCVRSPYELRESMTCHVVIDGDDGGVDMRQVHDRIEAALRLRTLYKRTSVYNNSNSNRSAAGRHHDDDDVAALYTDSDAVAMTRSLIADQLTRRVSVRVRDGVFVVDIGATPDDVDNSDDAASAAAATAAALLSAYTRPPRSWAEFAADVQRLQLTVCHKTCVRACEHRLGIMQERSRMFFLRNAEVEERHNIRQAGGVFARAVRVDAFVRLSKCADAQETVDLIVDACTRHGNTPIRTRSGVNTTLRELLEHHGVHDATLLTTEGLQWHVDANDGGDKDDDDDAAYNNDDDVDDVDDAQQQRRGDDSDSDDSDDEDDDDGAEACDELSAELRFTFLNVHGALAPRYLRRCLERAEPTRHTRCAAEYAIPLYAVHSHELGDVAAALHTAGLTSLTSVRWVLQLRLTQPAPPLLYATAAQRHGGGSSNNGHNSAATPLRRARSVQDQLDFLFLPLIEATLLQLAADQATAAAAANTGANVARGVEAGRAAAPTASQAALMAFVQQLGALQLEGAPDGLDVDFDAHARLPDEVPCVSSSTTTRARTRRTRRTTTTMTMTAAATTTASRQSELYYSYYVYANMCVLNGLRRLCGLHTLQLRTACNVRRTSSMDDVLAGYLVADVIARASKLMRYPVLQYLCGLHGVGLVLSPLADHVSGAVAYGHSPLPNFLHRCLRVTLSTEAPLLYHHNPHTALAEEYATAQKVFGLSALDVTELARNSVVVSSFAPRAKRSWLGARYTRGADGNEFGKTHVTCARLRYRADAWRVERDMLRDLHLCRSSGGGAAEQGATTSRWHYISSVHSTEYHNTVFDHRIRFPRTLLTEPSYLTGHRHDKKRHDAGSDVGESDSVSDSDDDSDSDSDDDSRDGRSTRHRHHRGRSRSRSRHRDTNDAQTLLAAAAAPHIARALDMRRRYIWRPPNPWEQDRRRWQRHAVEADFQRKTDTFNEDEWAYAASDAVYIAYPRHAVHAWPRSLPTLDDFRADLAALRAIGASADVKAFAHSRLAHLDHRFCLHLALNHANEAGTTEERASSNRDIYQATKVDTHIHMAAGMTPKQMLQFVLQKLRDNADDIAMSSGTSSSSFVTLGQLFAKVGITPQLTIDQLNVQADYTLFERFDNFNNKYNPMESGELRSLLLKTDNFMHGRYFAELIRDVFAQYERGRYTYAENRLSIYGTNMREWDKLAGWFATHGMASQHNKWVIQVPRVYKVFRAQNVIASFGQYLQNIFQPLWEASLHPAQHPTLHNFLNHVSGFDSVDNEATLDAPFTTLSPWAWTAVQNPPYNYYLYYLYANVRTLNEFRASRGFATFALRPHCGESGALDHLYGAFLCANSICHGINLRHDPAMEYLYYLAQIGLHVSPLSNNALFLHFLSNPFPAFFRRGLHVSLSTDDPMMFHQTQEPLIEEYSIAARVWGLSANDLCELARNSVVQCGFDDNFKRRAIGERWYMSSSLGNDALRTHLSDIRVAYRFETYHTELQLLEQWCGGRAVARFMMTAREERDIHERHLDDSEAGKEQAIILSTHDQAMEVMLRDMDVKREQIRVTSLQLEALRRQGRSLVDKITELAVRRQQRQEEEERRLHEADKAHYTRQRRPWHNDDDADADGATFVTVERATAQRLLHWRPLPTTALRAVRVCDTTSSTATSNSSSSGVGRPLPPLPPLAQRSSLRKGDDDDVDATAW